MFPEHNLQCQPLGPGGRVDTSFTDILVERAVSSRNFGENLLMKVKELTSFTVEDKKFRTVFLSSIQSKFKEMEVILKINQNHYANFIFFMKECIKHLRMPNDDPITALVNAFLELIPAALKPGITLEMAIVIRESMFSLFDDLWKFASPKCEEVLEDARELVIKNSFDMKIGNELLFLAEIVHYRCSGDIPSFLLTYYKEKGLKF
ncbi:hypothetical protein QYM36_009596 [Artemia franciscana]|uniref:Uncharacterized protein n=1 Tax=Artemia franciscana TaxID=6661 RepID=A0AA88HX36_ARTSF|nr:hypothetical protein QYM36_009596 [Artemia franciscana]